MEIDIEPPYKTFQGWYSGIAKENNVCAICKYFSHLAECFHGIIMPHTCKMKIELQPTDVPENKGPLTIELDAIQ